MGCSASLSFGQWESIDSLPSSFAADSTLPAAWDDSASISLAPSATEGSNMFYSQTAVWGFAARDGVARHNLSIRRTPTLGLAGEITANDPGGLARRSLGWQSQTAAVHLGDLAAWPDHPLLEGTSRQAGHRDSSLSHQIVYGPGLRPNGIDLEGTMAIWSTHARWREERDRQGSRQFSGTAVVGGGPITLGIRASRVPDHPTARILSLGVLVPSFQAEAAWLDRDGSKSCLAIYGQFQHETEATRIRIQGRHIPQNFYHNGLTTSWRGTTAAVLGWRQQVLPNLAFAAQVDALRDSLNAVRARGATDLTLTSRELTLQGRLRVSENAPDAPRWSAGVRLAGHLGAFSPFVTGVPSDSAGGFHLAGGGGLHYAKNRQEFTASTSFSATTGILWNLSHFATLPSSVGNTRFALGASGGWNRRIPLVAQGSVTCSW